MIVSPSIGGIARRLTDLFLTVDLPDSFQRQAQLQLNYIGHVFVPNGVETSTPTLWQAVLESSLAQLSMQGEIAELRSQNKFLKTRQQRLESEIEEGNLLISTLNSFSSTLIPFGPDSRFAGSSSSRVLGHLDKPPTPPSDHDDSILEAMRLKNEFDEEDRALSAQRTELTKSTQRLFECGICMEKMPDDSIARPDPCGHAFCRECLRGHVTARLNEHRFPILCPTCTVSEGKGKEAAGGTFRADGQLGYHLTICLLRCLAVPYPKPWAHRRAIQYLDRDGNGLLLCSLILSKVRPWYSLTRPSANTGIGANGRCSWPETNIKKLRSSFVHFRTVATCGASIVSSRSIQMVQSTRAMVHRN